MDDLSPFFLPLFENEGKISRMQTLPVLALDNGTMEEECRDGASDILIYYCQRFP